MQRTAGIPYSLQYAHSTQDIFFGVMALLHLPVHSTYKSEITHVVGNNSGILLILLHLAHFLTPH